MRSWLRFGSPAGLGCVLLLFRWELSEARWLASSSWEQQAAAVLAYQLVLWVEVMGDMGVCVK
uniref:DUF3778 domain-containing protein n=1 Tax=Oryza nivara TaxID=4536 RepID=A0A0E0GHP6_ORYNI